MFALYQSKPRRQHAVEPIFEGQTIGLKDLDFSHKKVPWFSEKENIGCHVVRNDDAPATM